MTKAASEAFSGFTPAALRFLRDLKKNNERAWFQERKELYERELLEPLQALTSDVAKAMRKAKIPIDADPRRSVFRIYRDVRFSHDKSPYKTNLGTYLPYKGQRDAPGGLYVYIEPKESFMAIAFYKIDKPLLQRWRDSMATEPKRFQEVLRQLERNGVGLDDQRGTLKRMPRGFEAQADGPLALYFRQPSFTVSEKLSDKDVTDERLVQRTVQLARSARPLLDFGWRLLE